jgi:hypothetical protein
VEGSKKSNEYSLNGVRWVGSLAQSWEFQYGTRTSTMPLRLVMRWSSSIARIGSFKCSST